MHCLLESSVFNYIIMKSDLNFYTNVEHVYTFIKTQSMIDL